MKQRLDVLLVERGHASTRSIAQAMIMAGEIMANTTVLTKAGQLVDSEIELQVADRPQYVSRGGNKLASVAEALPLDFNDAIVLDVGSSTGGFTDYALQNGATHSYAVDVGTNQLAYKLRNDPRITVMEQTDIRNVQPEILNPRPTIAVIDVSFISLTRILESVATLVTDGSPIIAMMKPQFETNKAVASKYRGVIKDDKIRAGIINDFETAIRPHFRTIASADSAVHGAQGNRERFYYLLAKTD